MYLYCLLYSKTLYVYSSYGCLLLANQLTCHLQHAVTVSWRSYGQRERERDGLLQTQYEGGKSSTPALITSEYMRCVGMDAPCGGFAAWVHIGIPPAHFHVKMFEMRNVSKSLLRRSIS